MAILGFVWLLRSVRGKREILVVRTSVNFGFCFVA